MTRPATVAEEALELARWLGDGQGLLARLQEAHRDWWLLQDIPARSDDESRTMWLLQGQVGVLIREAVEHFGRMP